MQGEFLPLLKTSLGETRGHVFGNAARPSAPDARVLLDLLHPEIILVMQRPPIGVGILLRNSLGDGGEGLQQAWMGSRLGRERHSCHAKVHPS